MRPLLVRLHRYAGLTIAGFLLVAGLTGSLLAWNEELECLISPELFLINAPAGNPAPMDSLALRDAVARQYPAAKIIYAPLKIENGRSLVFLLKSTRDAELPNDQVFVDPYTGTILGAVSYTHLRAHET